MSARTGIRDHFRMLATFEGREDRSSFWPYAALVLAIVMVAGSLMLIPVMAQSLEAVQAHAVQGPDVGQSTVSYGLEEFSMPIQDGSSGMMPSAGFLAAYLAVTLGLATALYAAAVVRRLHDRGRSGAWGLMPLPFLLYTSIQMIRLVDSTAHGNQADMGLFVTVAISNILYCATLLALIVLLAGASDLEPNRYDLGE